jgi:hypothetical protein
VDLCFGVFFYLYGFKLTVDMHEIRHRDPVPRRE